MTAKMKLPNSEQAYVPEQKLAEYLLSETHAIGKSKAKYFRTLGYTKTNSNHLRESLLKIAHSNEYTQMLATQHGLKYIIDGTLVAPNGSTMRLRTIWIVETIDNRPRFITAYPIK